MFLIILILNLSFHWLSKVHLYLQLEFILCQAAAEHRPLHSVRNAAGEDCLPHLPERRGVPARILPGSAALLHRTGPGIHRINRIV